MVKRLFLVYLLVELAVLVALVSTIGFGWTVLAVLGTFLVGLALAGRQLTRHLARLQSALNSRTSSDELASDSALVALGAVLVFIPGVASSVLGALLLMPPTRPVATAVIGRSLAKATPLVMTYPAGQPGYRRPTRTDYVEGEVIDVVDVEHTTEPTSVEHRTITPD
ncbi:FxsA family protein [Mycobacterium frederiksbergense]|uniref:FxsA family protein n=1 Tax=Mycolicibacterium frederiksbergense TaxID=117567 RepID=UPI0021F3BE0E|nr:FxsA family protein [Mycolicibacterium frederiksbergense]MCV7048286.1 FxsA family protein [Mycolicibacterium frederiksbergense]